MISRKLQGNWEVVGETEQPFQDTPVKLQVPPYSDLDAGYGFIKPKQVDIGEADHTLTKEKSAYRSKATKNGKAGQLQRNNGCWRNTNAMKHHTKGEDTRIS